MLEFAAGAIKSAFAIATWEALWWAARAVEARRARKAEQARARERARAFLDLEDG